MKIAVTGASGFVGRHVLTALAEYPDLSVVASSRAPEPPEFLPNGFEYTSLEMATTDGAVYDKLGAPDVLIHLAWGGLPNYRAHHHFEDELPQQYAFLRAMVEGGLPSLVVSGTCYEYGMTSGCLREDQLCEPNNSYAFAKKMLYHQLLFLQTQRPFGLTWARLFYCYGAGQAASSLLPLLQSAVELGEKRFAMSGGEQLRDYLAVETVAQHLVQLAILNADPGAVNICSGKPISIRRFVEEQKALHGWDIKFDFGKYPYVDYEPMAFWGDAGKLERLMESRKGQNQ